MNHWFQQWVVFLFGTPKRTLITLGVLCAILLVIKPELGKIFATNLMIALMPFLQLAITLIVIGFGVKFLFKGFRSPTKK